MRISMALRIEAELAFAGIEDDIEFVSAEDSSYTRPEEDLSLCRTGCDSLAIAKTSHGHLDFKPGTSHS